MILTKLSDDIAVIRAHVPDQAIQESHGQGEYGCWWWLRDNAGSQMCLALLVMKKNTADNPSDTWNHGQKLCG